MGGLPVAVLDGVSGTLVNGHNVDDWAHAIGALLNFVVTLSLTPLCAPPSEASRDMVDQVREPEMLETGPRVPGL